ncbi:MAG: pyridine nucleotide-disulfide oxidoreductase family [Acidobacteria bacterium]|nr:pyridine nucleotide-disulfide oxidoreductase family [Acidobacteriota bacterium]
MTDKTVVVVGGGLSGALFGLKLHRIRPGWRIVVVEPKKKLGRGIAYGACGPGHLLNVPVSRMEVGLTPGFAQWLEPQRSAIAEALVESHLDLAAAFVPRRLFGDYMEERVGEALSLKARSGFTAVRGEAVRLLEDGRGVLLTDGREIGADIVVLAMGNLPPRPPGGPDRWLYDTGYFIPDPWAADAFSDIDPGEPLLLIGAGLTTVDIALRLAAEGHRGKMLAVSRRGLKPRRHKAGGAWPEFLHDKIPASPLVLTRLIRAEIAKAQSQDIPWQRVFDAARPAVPAVWESWSDKHRRQFLRHLRPRWDIHRHRTAPRIGTALDALLDSGQLEIVAGRIAGYREAGAHLDVSLKLRGGAMREFRCGHVVNCTGPGSDFDKIAIPLIADLRVRRLATPDALGVGFETRDCAVLDASGKPSSWLFALGPLTRPAWWEITAVPEINLQVERLVAQITQEKPPEPLTTADFFGMGEGI